MERKQAEHEARMNQFKAEIALVKQRESAIKAATKQSKEAVKAIMDIAQKPVMSLSDELYGTANQPYSTKIWESNSSYATRISRIAHSQSPAAQALTGRFVDLVYGTNLELQAQPFYDLIPGAPKDIEAQQAEIKNIERRWYLWAKSNKSDYYQEKSYFKSSRDDFGTVMVDGEYFLILRYGQSRKRNPLTIQTVKRENIKRIDSLIAQGNEEIDGIEYNSAGVAVAYHVYDCKTGKSTRVTRYGIKSGRTFVIHVKLGEERRGVGLLAGIISELTKLSDFQALEIQAAVINALFAVWVETPIGGNNKNIIPTQGIGGIGKQIDSVASQFSISEFGAKVESTDFQHGGLLVQQMGEGQRLNSFDTKRPTANFEQFFNAVKRNLMAAKGMSLAVADYNFNGQYAAARGELLVLWLRVTAMRFDMIMQRENEVYKMWLWGEIDNENVKDYGFSRDEFIRDAFSNAEWTGPARPDIDPLKSVKAHQIEDEMGYKTAQMISAERGGGDFDENVSRKITENNARVKANENYVRMNKTTYSESKATTESTSVSKAE